MRFALTKDHLDFFYRNHYIEFENLLTIEEVFSLEDAIEEVLTKRMGENRDPKKVYLAGSHCWQDDPRIKKVALSPRLAEIASQLTKERTLRLASSLILFGGLSEEKVSMSLRPLKTSAQFKKCHAGSFSTSLLPKSSKILNLKCLEVPLSSLQGFPSHSTTAPRPRNSPNSF